MPPARHPPPASADLTPFNSHCPSLFPSPFSLRSPPTVFHPSPLGPSPSLAPFPSQSSLRSAHSFFTPHSPALRRQPAAKSGPSYLSPSGPCPGLTKRPRPDPPPHAPLPTHARPTQAASWRVPASAKRRPAAPPSPRRPQPESSPPPAPPRPRQNTPAAPQEFFGKNSYAHKAPQFRPATHPPLDRAKPSTLHPHNQR